MPRDNLLDWIKNIQDKQCSPIPKWITPMSLSFILNHIVHIVMYSKRYTFYMLSVVFYNEQYIWCFPLFQCYWLIYFIGMSHFKKNVINQSFLFFMQCNFYAMHFKCKIVNVIVLSVSIRTLLTEYSNLSYSNLSITHYFVYAHGGDIFKSPIQSKNFCRHIHIFTG